MHRMHEFSQISQKKCFKNTLKYLDFMHSENLLKYFWFLNPKVVKKIIYGKIWGEFDEKPEVLQSLSASHVSKIY